MRDGKLKAFGESQSLFRHPPNRFAAEFLGRANLLPVSDLRPADGQMARVRFGELTLSARNHHGIPANTECLLCVRPHDFRFSHAAGEPNSIFGTVLSVQWQGDVQNITLNIGGEEVRMTSAPMANPPRIGETISVHFDPAEVTLIPEDAGHG